MTREVHYCRVLLGPIGSYWVPEIIIIVLHHLRKKNLSLPVRGWTSAFLLDVHGLCSAIEGRLSHRLPRWLRTGWQRVISQGKLPRTTPPRPRIEPEPQGGQTVGYICSPTELSWPGPRRGQTVRYICSPTEPSWLTASNISVPHCSDVIAGSIAAGSCVNEQTIKQIERNDMRAYLVQLGKHIGPKVFITRGGQKRYVTNTCVPHREDTSWGRPPSFLTS